MFTCVECSVGDLQHFDLELIVLLVEPFSNFSALKFLAFPGSYLAPSILQSTVLSERVSDFLILFRWQRWRESFHRSIQDGVRMLRWPKPSSIPPVGSYSVCEPLSLGERGTSRASHLLARASVCF